MDIFGIIIAAVVIFLLIVIIRSFRIVPQAHVFVVERLGSFHAEWQTGIHILVPFVDRIAGKVSLKEKVVDFKPQPVITKDNVTMQIDTVVFYQVTDSKQYIYGVERPLQAIENLSATTLRNIIGELELDAAALIVMLSVPLLSSAPLTFIQLPFVPLTVVFLRPLTEMSLD